LYHPKLYDYKKSDTPNHVSVLYYLSIKLYLKLCLSVKWFC